MERTYYTPRGILQGQAAKLMVADGRALSLCGSSQSFAAVEVTRVDGASVSSSMAQPKVIPAEVTKPRLPFAGLDGSRTRIMGVLNVTPDSFSDGGIFASCAAAVAHGIALCEAGADMIDVGGESTRPGATPVDPDEECRRVIPIVRALSERGVLVSIDTRHAKVMAAALEAGAAIVNDISALGDRAALGVVARSTAALVLMHMQGDPMNMQKAPSYVWAPGDIYDFLGSRISLCLENGIARERISVDPGIGFGKTDAHNIQIIDHLAMFHGLGCVLTFGASRKGFIGRMGGDEAPTARLPGSIAAALMAAQRGAHILRVHDVAETRQALAVWQHLSGC